MSLKTPFPHWPGSYGLPFPVTGNVLFVDSGHALASDNNLGDSAEQPLATIEGAFNHNTLTANNGDVVMVMPGHAETVSAAGGIDMDVAGVTVWGFGIGSDRPTITFDTAVGADVDIDAANIWIHNILFSGGIDALTGPVDINAADCKLTQIETRDTTGQATDFIATDANADRLMIDGWVHRGSASDGPDSAITIVGGDDIEIKNFNIYGNFDQGAIESVTTAAVRINIHDGYIWTEGAEDLAVVMKSDTTGRIGPNIEAMLQDNAANVTEAFVGAACQFFQPIEIVNLVGETSLKSNITASTDA
jgi:hypothetical protein